MKFDYVQKSSHALSEDTLKLLEEIDAFPYALIQPKFNTLGDLHNTLTVEVVDKVERKIIIVRRTIGEIKRRIAELEKEELQILAKRKQMLEDMRRRQDWSQERFLPVFEHQWELDLLKRALDDNSNKPDDYPVSIEVPIYRSGYYMRSGQDAKVVLVYDNKEAIAITYIHEMMHAYYDSDRKGNSPNIIEYVEEPLAEYGMLHFLATFATAHPQYRSLFQQALADVHSKQNSICLTHYGFGEYLYRNYAHLDWEAKMLVAKAHVSTTDKNYINLQNIFQSGYPQPQQLPATAQLLYDILITADGRPTQSIGKPQVSPYSISRTASGHGSRSAANGKSFSVEFPDGTIIAEPTAIDTYIVALHKFGLSTVQNIGLEDGGYNIVSDTERLDNGRKWQTFANGKYIYTAIAKKSMIANLALVAGELGMQITIKKC